MGLNILHASLWALYFAVTRTQAQILTVPSNYSGDLFPAANSPRFLLNGTEFPNLPLIELAPLSIYVEIPKTVWMQIDDTSRLIDVGTSNSNQVPNGDFAYVSCDPEAYDGYLNASNVIQGVLYNLDSASTVLIMYSIYSDHCNISNLDNAPQIASVFTTTNPVTASMLAKLNLNGNSKGMAQLLPDLNSFTNQTGNFGSSNGNLLGPSPTTAVAMIILYSITGIITALFIVIIITGAIRAHRHPERYGPRNIGGRSRQSRAKGIARAMLETLPIVRFGDHDDNPPKPVEGAAAAAGGDIEMNTADTTVHDQTTVGPKELTESKDKSVETETVVGASSETLASSSTPAAAPKPLGDGTQDDGSLGCSICTEDFTKGEDVRVLPCNHKFHPDCVDPWLLNVSGTCPLCRIDLQPKKEGEEAGGEAGENGEASVARVEGELPPPLVLDGGSGSGSGFGGRRNTMASLVQRAMVDGTREERLAALRRLRMERERQRSVASMGEGGAEERQRGLTRRLRERFRIRTEGGVLARDGAFRS